MVRFLLPLLVLVVLLSSGCGAVFVSGFTNAGSTVSVGTVSIVRLSVTGDGTVLTFVTLLDNRGPQDLSFCGDLRNDFPVNSTVRVNFTPATPCISSVAVVLVS